MIEEQINQQAESVAAQIDTITNETVAVTLGNVSRTRSRRFIVQTGTHAEHHRVRVKVSGRNVDVDATSFSVPLDPGSGTRLVIHTKRSADTPTMNSPWDD